MQETKMMPYPKISGLYAITPDTADSSLLVAMTQQVLQAGTGIIQYRNKSASAALRLEQASLLSDLCQQRNALLIINDYPDLVTRVNAAGIHLGQEDMPVAEARRLIGADKIIGISCYNQLQRAVNAQNEGADYVAFGAFYPSTTKRDAVTAPVALLEQAKRQLRIPVVAIGGITPDNAVNLTAQGVDALAVSHALFGAEDITSTATRFMRLIA
jgi:thiamine-phosphate pyrophosphorylase